MTDDTRALRDRLEATQVELREARAEVEALRKRVAELEAPRELDLEVGKLRLKLEAQAEELRESKEREERLMRESDARGVRLVSLSAELDRYRAVMRRAEPPVKKVEVRPKESGAPKPPPPPPPPKKPAPKSREPSPAVESERAAPDDEPAPAQPSQLPPSRPNNPRPMTPGRVIIGGGADLPQRGCGAAAVLLLVVGALISLSPIGGEGRGEGKMVAAAARKSSVVFRTSPHPRPLPRWGRGSPH